MGDRAMVGRKGYYGRWCKCCGRDAPRLVKVRERRAWRREMEAERNGD
jgi:hypothetical protein